MTVIVSSWLPSQLIFKAVLMAAAFTSCFAQSNICSDAKTCGTCVVLDQSCGWCTTEMYKDADGNSYPRCDIITNLNQNGCGDIINPMSSSNKTKDEPLSDAGSQSTSRAVQVKPQAVHLKLRPGLPAEITLNVRQATDYPVDLYYLMDLSHSMNDDLNNLKELGSTLATQMKAITTNFRLGFGSFVDKTVIPYVSTAPSKLLHPCAGCEAPYGFKNVLPLDNNTDSFTRIVRSQISSGNVDIPEGVLDALMQVTVCKNAIGWRDQARHLVIITTDAPFHYAGDGKLGGIVTPNDGKCHLSPTEYLMSHELDYPSISQLNYKMHENSVIPIFAVTIPRIQIYSKLTHFIEGATAGILAADSSNIVDLMKENYEKITSKVQIVDSAPENIKIEYVAYCLRGEVTPGSKECRDLKLGDTVNFTLSVTATTCPDQRIQTFTVRPVGFTEEMTVTVEVVCECDCESQSVPTSDHCSMGNGTLECGSCKCNPGRYGQDCECSSSDADLGDNDSSCRPGNSSIVCSGRGSCFCGECVCFERPNKEEQVSSTYCDCDNFSCDRYKGELCGGPDHGVCVCDEKTKRSKCQCKPEYQGDACDCSTSTETCVASNGLSCNAHGECKCGRCECNATTPYRGERCEECQVCPDKCEVNKDCVQCKHFGTEQCDRCPPVIVYDELPAVDEVEEHCLYHDEMDCLVMFTYQTLENGTFLLIVQKEPVCPEPVNSAIIIACIVVGIILIGLLLLIIWRTLTYIHDSQEFARFEKDLAKAKWDKDENPLYKSSTSTYNNPQYDLSIISGSGLSQRMASNITAQSMLAEISQGHLECPICSERFKQPKLLECSHSFCLECLQQLRKKSPSTTTLPCPVCRHKTLLKENGIHGLKTNFSYLSLLEDIEKQETQLKQQEKQSQGQEHHSKCSKHTDKDLIMYCDTCKKFICTPCIVRDHQSHSLIEINYKFKQLATELVAKVRRNIQTFKIAIQEIDMSRKTMDSMFAATKKKVSKKGNEEVARIRNEEQKLMQEAEQIYRDRVKAMENARTTNSKKVTKAEHKLDEVNQLMDQRSHFRIAHHIEQFLKDLKEYSEMKSMKVPHNFVYMNFEENQKALGKLVLKYLKLNKWTLKSEIAKFRNTKQQIVEFYPRDVAAYSNSDTIVSDLYSSCNLMTISVKGSPHQPTIPQALSINCLTEPRKLPVNKKDELIVLDDKSVKIFNRNFQLLYQFNPGSEPTCIAAYGNSLIAVGHKNKAEISLHKPDGFLIKKLPAPGIDDCLTTYKQHLIYVNWVDKKLVSVDYNGEVVFSSSQSGQSYGVCCDTDGSIYVSVWTRLRSPNASSGEIHHYSPDGKYIRCIIKELVRPFGITPTPVGDLHGCDYR